MYLTCRVAELLIFSRAYSTWSVILSRILYNDNYLFITTKLWHFYDIITLRLLQLFAFYQWNIYMRSESAWSIRLWKCLRLFSTHSALTLSSDFFLNDKCLCWKNYTSCDKWRTACSKRVFHAQCPYRKPSFSHFPSTNEMLSAKLGEDICKTCVKSFCVLTIKIC